jgi:hypothetical protein
VVKGDFKEKEIENCLEAVKLIEIYMKETERIALKEKLVSEASQSINQGFQQHKPRGAKKASKPV